ncbi:MAG: Ig-like domain-containing protein [Saprospiraceae bacterium]
MNIKKQITVFAILFGMLIVGCLKDQFNEYQGKCPIVISTDPANNDVDVPINKVISVTFNEKMNPLTINNESFKINGDSAVSGTISYSGNTAYFTPDRLLKINTLYTGRVTTMVKDSIGNALQADYVWTFTTGSQVVPLVVSTDPANDEIDVVLNKTISATFNLDMDPATINTSSFKISDGVNLIPGVVTYNGTTAYFNPTNILKSNTVYTGIITTEVTSLTGKTLENDYVWTFTTIGLVAPFVISTDPENNATDVPLNKIITATFSVPMDPTTVNNTHFIIRNGVNTINGTVSLNGAIATFTPASPLSANTIYTGTISSFVKDLAGTNLAQDYIWVFSTGQNIAPIVVSTSPTNNEINVLTNKIVTATFSVPMDPFSINTTSFSLRNGSTIIPGVVSYSGIVASFTPSIPLSPNTTYTGIILATVRNVIGTNMAADYIWSFTTAAVVAPIVISTDPVNNAIQVVLNKIIKASFSMPMDPTTINTSSFILRQGSNSVSGVVTYSGITATFTPLVPLLPNTIYTATITTAAKNTMGISLENNYVWSFTTLAVIAPIVISTDPVNNATNVTLNKQIKASFSVPMDPATINTNSFTVAVGTTLISGIVTYSGVTATFTPSTALLPNTKYTATITTAVKSLAGINLANNYVWSFTTETVQPPFVVSTDPTNNSTNVSLNKIVLAVFNMPMDPTSINSSSYTIKQGSNIIAGTISYSGLTASFTPSSNFNSNTLYTATLTTAVKNLAGVSLSSNYVWSFTTLVVPIVVSTDPINNATGVKTNQVISANFNMNMDPLTINASTFLLKEGTNLITGIISYSGVTAKFTPNVLLSPNTVYTATLTTGVKNLNGISLSNDYVWTFMTSPTIYPPLVYLGTAERFGILAGVGISNNAGFSEIHDLDVGISPGVRSSIVGFPPAIVVNGGIFASDDIAPPGIAAMLIQAKKDLTAAYNFAAGASSPPPVTVSGDQGGKTLAPGIYKTNSTLLIQSGDLTLDAQGDPNAVWIFQIASGFTTVGGAGGNVILSGGAQASNVFWQTGSSATIGDYTSFEGNILALTSITMNSHAVANGRMLAINAAVVMTSTNFINRP